MRLLAALVGSALAAIAQPSSDVLLRQTFENDTGSWFAMGTGATLREANHALSLTYEPRPKQFAAAVMPATPAFPRFERMRFRIRSDYDTALGVLLSEKEPGGRYLASFWSPANTWQEIELTTADFIASDGPGDPVDPDGKLDTDSLTGVGILDLAAFISSLPNNPDFPVIINRPSGTHTIEIESFELRSTPGGRAGPGVIDAFDRGFLRWITLGGINLKLSTAGNPLGMRALEAKYQQTEGQFGLLVRQLSNLDLSKATRLAFDVASEQESTLIVALESKRGERYNMMIYPPGKREVFHVSLKWGDFEGTGKMDPGQLKSLFITDVTTATGGGPGVNTIWIGKVEAPSN
ncbi:MAG TPA: hypothetical protein VMH81_35615 [Bryobacteraceae bacterium]|nr:hypothetical protein [Bryobacteraceae bacterium]